MKIFIADNLKTRLGVDIRKELTLDKNIEVTYLRTDNPADAVLKAEGYEVVFWLINDNWVSVKSVVPTAIVIGYLESRQRMVNVDELAAISNGLYGGYKPFVDLLNESLLHRDNLTIASDGSGYQLYDPLGTQWYKGNSIPGLVYSLMKRTAFLLNTHRERTKKADITIEVPDNTEFFNYVHEAADIFHETIQHSPGVTRLLGNASFRGSDSVIYASERDVDKALVSKETFVPAFDENGITMYSGIKKPSKDTVVQLRLYGLFKNINYIVHSHCYVKGAPYTAEPVPCGALEEVDEVIDVINKAYNGDFTRGYYAVNLIGHGCLVFASDLAAIRKTEYFTRQLPEVLNENVNGYSTTNKEPA